MAKKQRAEERSLKQMLKRAQHRSPALQAAFDDGAVWGANDMRTRILDYLLHEYIMDLAISRDDPKYQATLDIVHEVSHKFKGGKKVD